MPGLHRQYTNTEYTVNGALTEHWAEHLVLGAGVGVLIVLHHGAGMRWWEMGGRCLSVTVTVRNQNGNNSP